MKTVQCYLQLRLIMTKANKNNYILHGPVPLIPVAEGTAGLQVFHALKRYEHLPVAVVDAEKDTAISYKQLLETSCRVAYSLKKFGIGSESVVSIFSENSLNYYYPLLASLFLSITVAPVSPDYVGEELQNAVNISKPRILFCSKSTMEKALSLQQNLEFLPKIVVMDSDTSTDKAESINSFMDTSKDVSEFKPINHDPHSNIALILCSSGTTGPPKGVILTDRNISVKLAQLKDPILGFLNKPTTKALSVFPMCHIGGLGVMLMYLILGLRSILIKNFSAKLYLKSIQDYQVESTFVAPPVMAMLAKSSLVEQYNLSSLKDIECGAAPLPKEIIGDVLKRLPHVQDVRQAYGLTETTMAVTFSPRGDSKIGSSGKLLPLTSAKVIDMKTQQTLGPYQEGELCFKGESIMKGYVCNTSKIIDDDGWLYTGDIGYYDNDEHFYILDRSKELIKYKGYQISPAELEALLMKHPKIKDAAVIGINHSYVGDLARAYVVRQPNEILSEQEVAEFVAAQISHQKHLHGGVVFIDKIPRSPSGKILRKRLRELDEEDNGKNTSKTNNLV